VENLGAKLAINGSFARRPSGRSTGEEYPSRNLGFKEENVENGLASKEKDVAVKFKKLKVEKRGKKPHAKIVGKAKVVSGDRGG